MVLHSTNISKLIHWHTVIHVINVNSILHDSSHLHCWSKSIVVHLRINISSLILSIIDEVIVSFLIVIKPVIVIIPSTQIVYVSYWIISNDVIVVHHLVSLEYLVCLMGVVMDSTGCRLIVHHHWILEWACWRYWTWRNTWAWDYVGLLRRRCIAIF